jgi:hypothetical protein
VFDGGFDKENWERFERVRLVGVTDTRRVRWVGRLNC